MTVNYDAELHSREFIDRVCETFVNELRNLADCQDTFGPAARRERDCPDHRLVATQLRQIAEEVLHLPITVHDMNRDLESELGVDSLERIRIITRIQPFFEPVDRRALFAARLNEVIAACAGRPAETAVAERSASPASAVVPATPNASARPVSHRR